MLIVWNLGIQKEYSMFIDGADKFKNEPGVHFEKFMAPRGKHLTFSFISGASARARAKHLQPSPISIEYLKPIDARKFGYDVS